MRAKTEDGHEGLGFRYGGNTAGILVADVVRELLRPVLIGQDVNRVEGLWQQMYSEVLLQGRLGSVMRAISIVDVALWDRNARAARLPLHRYLGVVADDRVPAYTSGGYNLDGKSANDLGEEMAGYVVLGFRAVKNGNSDVG